MIRAHARRPVSLALPTEVLERPASAGVSRSERDREVHRGAASAHAARVADLSRAVGAKSPDAPREESPRARCMASARLCTSALRHGAFDVVLAYGGAEYVRAASSCARGMHASPAGRNNLVSVRSLWGTSTGSERGAAATAPRPTAHVASGNLNRETDGQRRTTAHVSRGRAT